MRKSSNHVVIMAGGVGSRFWPMSTVERPKQFIDVLGVGRSLMQLTFDRFAGICPSENVWIVTNKKYADICREQLPDVPAGNILCEPCRRNTAPCIAYVSWRIKSQDPKANIVVTPSDHIVTNETEFRRVITQCMKFTAESDAIITLGMKPTRPETGYGYIQADLTASSVSNKEIFRVDSFREKPDFETAQKYIQQKNYYWNAGIFIWNVSIAAGQKSLLKQVLFSLRRPVGLAWVDIWESSRLENVRFLRQTGILSAGWVMLILKSISPVRQSPQRQRWQAESPDRRNCRKGDATWD